MTYPVFLSVALIINNVEGEISTILKQCLDLVSGLVSDYEVIVIANGSTDNTVSTLRNLTQEGGLPNLQVYCLTQEVDFDTAAWVGVENALGDYVAVLDPTQDCLSQLLPMLEKALMGVDVVFASNKAKAKQTIPYAVAQSVFNVIYKHFNGIHLATEAPPYRILSKSMINYILQHPQPAIAYRHLPASAGFAKENIEYLAQRKNEKPKKLSESIDKGAKLLTSTTHAPMRIVTSFSLFGAFMNIIYTIYVIGVGLFSSHVQPGWISLSLQQSGMFFLLSLVLFVLGEYILQMASLSNEGPRYHIAKEFTSATMTRHKKLNLEIAEKS